MIVELIEERVKFPIVMKEGSLYVNDFEVPAHQSVADLGEIGHYYLDDRFRISNTDYLLARVFDKTDRYLLGTHRRYQELIDVLIRAVIESAPVLRDTRVVRITSEFITFDDWGRVNLTLVRPDDILSHLST